MKREKKDEEDEMLRAYPLQVDVGEERGGRKTRRRMSLTLDVERRYVLGKWRWVAIISEKKAEAEKEKEKKEKMKKNKKEKKLEAEQEARQLAYPFPALMWKVIALCCLAVVMLTLGLPREKCFTAVARAMEGQISKINGQKEHAS